jgi:hypothetical protein
VDHANLTRRMIAHSRPRQPSLPLDFVVEIFTLSLSPSLGSMDFIVWPLAPLDALLLDIQSSYPRHVPSPFTHQSHPFFLLVSLSHFVETNNQISESSQINPSTFPTSLHPSFPRSSNGVNTTGPIPPLRRLPILMIQGGRPQKLENGIPSGSLLLLYWVVADDRFIQVDQEMLFEIILAAK